MVDVVIPLYRPDAKTGILLRRLLKQDYEINRIILINTEKEYFNDVIKHYFTGKYISYILQYELIVLSYKIQYVI